MGLKRVVDALDVASPPDLFGLLILHHVHEKPCSEVGVLDSNSELFVRVSPCFRCGHALLECHAQHCVEEMRHVPIVGIGHLEKKEEKIMKYCKVNQNKILLLGNLETKPDRMHGIVD